MSFIIKATASAFRDLIRFKIAWIIIWPILVSTLLWLIVGFIFQDSFSELILLVLSEIGIGEWLQNMESGWITSGIQSLIHIILFIPLVIITTLLITTIFVMPALIQLVAKRSYPELKREYGGTLSGSIINAILASVIFILIWVITVPLWAVGAGIIIPF